MTPVSLATAAQPGLAPLVTSLFRAWRAAGIDFVVLRNHEGLPRHVGNDLDILVDPRRFNEAEAVALTAALDAGFELVHRAEFSPVSLFLRSPQGPVLHLDLFRSLVWRGFPILPPAKVLSSRRRGALFDVPSLVDESVLNLLTRLVYRGHVRQKYRAGIASTFAFHRETASATVQRTLGRKCGRFVLSAVERGDWTVLEGARRRVRAALARRALMADGRAVFAEWYRDLGRYRRRLRHPPGVLVAFLGPDGSGKSSLATMLPERLAHTFYPGMGRYIHWRPSVLRRRSVPDSRVSNPHALPRRSRFASLLYLAYHVTDYAIGRIAVIAPVLFRNGLVVCDRYYHDFYVDPRRYRLDVPSGAVRLGHRFVREPDLVFCLVPSVPVLRARKQELPAHEVAHQRSAYLALARGLPHGRAVESDGSLSEVLDEVEAAVCQLLRDRINPLDVADSSGDDELRQGGYA